MADGRLVPIWPKNGVNGEPGLALRRNPVSPPQPRPAWISLTFGMKGLHPRQHTSPCVHGHQPDQLEPAAHAGATRRNAASLNVFAHPASVTVMDWRGPVVSSDTIDTQVLAPDHMAEALAEAVDNVVPSYGYQTQWVVGLGGSAGSLNALRQFLANVPPDSGIAYVGVTHLSPDHESVCFSSRRRRFRSRPVRSWPHCRPSRRTPAGPPKPCLPGHVPRQRWWPR
jgi:hypothetical protein